MRWKRLPQGVVMTKITSYSCCSFDAAVRSVWSDLDRTSSLKGARTTSLNAFILTLSPNSLKLFRTLSPVQSVAHRVNMKDCTVANSTNQQSRNPNGLKFPSHSATKYLLWNSIKLRNFPLPEPSSKHFTLCTSSILVQPTFLMTKKNSKHGLSQWVTLKFSVCPSITKYPKDLKSLPPSTASRGQEVHTELYVFL